MASKLLTWLNPIKDATVLYSMSHVPLEESQVLGEKLFPVASSLGSCHSPLLDVVSLVLLE